MIDSKKLYSDVGANIKNYRDKLLTQTELGDRLELSRVSISNIETGSQKPSIALLFQICEILDCEISDLLPELDKVRLDDSKELQKTNMGLFEVEDNNKKILDKFIRNK